MDALAGNVLGEIMYIGLGVFNARVGYPVDGKKPGAMTDAVGVAIGECLENGFRSVCLSGVHGFFDKMGVGKSKSALVVSMTVNLIEACSPPKSHKAIRTFRLP